MSFFFPSFFSPQTAARAAPQLWPTRPAGSKRTRVRAARSEGTHQLFLVAFGGLDEVVKVGRALLEARDGLVDLRLLLLAMVVLATRSHGYVCVCVYDAQARVVVVARCRVRLRASKRGALLEAGGKSGQIVSCVRKDSRPTAMASFASMAAKAPASSAQDKNEQADDARCDEVRSETRVVPLLTLAGRSNSTAGYVERGRAFFSSFFGLSGLDACPAPAGLPRPLQAASPLALPASHVLLCPGDPEDCQTLPRQRPRLGDGYACPCNAPPFCSRACSGQLLGLDGKNDLEVTNCFPFPNAVGGGFDEDDDGDAGTEYQIEMMRCLREVNVDAYTVGWYQTADLSSFSNETLLETQYNYQTNPLLCRKCVALVYDPIMTMCVAEGVCAHESVVLTRACRQSGKLSIRALRLSTEFCDLYTRDPDLVNESFDRSKIFVEVPIRIVTNVLAEAFLQGLRASGE